MVTHLSFLHSSFFILIISQLSLRITFKPSGPNLSALHCISSASKQSSFLQLRREANTHFLQNDGQTRSQACWHTYSLRNDWYSKRRHRYRRNRSSKDDTLGRQIGRSIQPSQYLDPENGRHDQPKCSKPYLNHCGSQSSPL